MESSAHVTTNKSPGSPGRESKLELGVSVTGHLCSWAFGEPSGQHPPIHVGVGGAATPPPLGHVGLPGQSEHSTTLPQGLGPGLGM